MKNSVKLSVIQMNVEITPEKNIKKAGTLIEQAAIDGAGIVVLPEMFICPYTHHSFARHAEPFGESSVVHLLAETAKNLGIYLFAGSLPERSGNRIYNTCPVFSPEGEMIAWHRKLHLFDIDIPGELVFKESDTLTAGNDFTVVETVYGKVGVAICFDIRFPEMQRIMALDGVSILVVPAAFNMVTGPAHWDILFRSRAIDNQIYVAVSSPARNPEADYTAYGHSMIINPWGEILEDAGEGESIISASLTPQDYQSIKRRLPLESGRRKDLYLLEKHRKDKK